MSREGPDAHRTRNARFAERLGASGPVEERRDEVVGSWALRPVGRRAGLRDYLGQLVERRHFIWADSRARAFSGNRNMILGNLWLILLPLLDGLFYYLIFGLVLEISRGMDNFIAFLLIGIFMFQFTSRSLNAGASAITGARNMVRAFSFPRASLPIAIVTREAISMLPVVITMVVLILTIPPHVSVTWHWLIFPAIFAFQMLFNLGIAFFAARATAHIPDLRHLIGVFARFWRYGSAVIFPLTRFVDDPRILGILELNPLFIIIDMYRSILLHNEVPALGSWVLIASWSVGTAVLGFVYFWRAEEHYGQE